MVTQRMFVTRYFNLGGGIMKPVEIICYILLLLNIFLWEIIGFPIFSIFWLLLIIFFMYLRGIYGDFNVINTLKGGERRKFPFSRAYWDDF